jgi:glycosyltransferase 2 family protein
MWHGDHFDVPCQLWRRSEVASYAPQGLGVAVSQHPGLAGNSALGIDDHADRRRSRHRTRRQLGIIGRDRLGTNDHGIRQRAQPVQVLPVLFARDVVGVTGPRGDETIDALSQLGDRDRWPRSDQGSVSIEQRRIRPDRGPVRNPALQQLAPHIGQVAGVMAHPVALCREVEGVLGALGHWQRDPGSYLNAKITKSIALVRVRRE